MRTIFGLVTPLLLTLACSSTTGGGSATQADAGTTSPPDAGSAAGDAGSTSDARATADAGTTKSHIGGACKSVADCAAPANVCSDDPGGQCQKNDCTTDADCGAAGLVCGRIDPATKKGTCYPACADIANNDCARKAEGYTCQQDVGDKIFCDAGPYLGDSCSRPGDPLMVKCPFGMVCSSDPAPAQACQNDAAGGKACTTDADCAKYGPDPYVCTNHGTCYKPCSNVLTNDCARKADGLVCQIDTGLTGTAYCDAGNPSYVVKLTATAEQPTPCATAGAAATGTLTLSVDAANRVISVSGFTYSGLSGAPTMVHIHANETAAKPGPHVLNFAVPAGAGASGTIADAMFHASDFIPDTATPPVGPTTFDDFIVALEKGYAYVNIHTSSCGSGEIWGQIVKN